MADALPRRAVRCAPMASPYTFLDHDGPLAFAHRGGAGVHPENTWVAFEHAVALGYRYLETDVRLTADGVVVAFHDATLDRVSDRSGAIARMRWDEVRRARIGGAHAPVRLDELLEAFPSVRVNIDPKEDAVVDPLVRVIERAGAVDRVCIASFRDARPARARELLGPRLCWAGGPRAIARLRLRPTGTRGRAVARDQAVARGQAGVVPCVQVPVRLGRVRIVDERFVAAAHAAGTAVHVWTIDDPVEMARLLDLGVDGIMTDQPDALRGVLMARGLWPSS
jgi:glycerophosphoryl diester phosphodiesterase